DTRGRHDRCHGVAGLHGGGPLEPRRGAPGDCTNDTMCVTTWRARSTAVSPECAITQMVTTAMGVERCALEIGCTAGGAAVGTYPTSRLSLSARRTGVTGGLRPGRQTEHDVSVADRDPLGTELREQRHQPRQVGDLERDHRRQVDRPPLRTEVMHEPLDPRV